jgi:hypothetical protein
MIFTIEQYNSLKDKSIKKEMRTNNEFQNNVYIHNKYEYIARDKICKLKNVKPLDKLNKDNLYDFETDDGMKYEVKSMTCILTKNIVMVEFSRGDKLTGISVSLAPFYIICDKKDGYYLIKTKKLIKLCHHFNHIEKQLYNWCYIIPFEDFVNNSIKI